MGTCVCVCERETLLIKPLSSIQIPLVYLLLLCQDCAWILLPQRVTSTFSPRLSSLISSLQLRLSPHSLPLGNLSPSSAITVSTALVQGLFISVQSAVSRVPLWMVSPNRAQEKVLDEVTGVGFEEDNHSLFHLPLTFRVRSTSKGGLRGWGRRQLPKVN